MGSDNRCDPAPGSAVRAHVRHADMKRRFGKIIATLTKRSARVLCVFLLCMAQLLPASVLPVKPAQTAVIKSAPAKVATHKFAEKDGDGFRIALFVLCCLV